MKDLIIKKTKVTPEIKFFNNGNLTIEGISLPEDAKNFYDKLLSFINKLNSESISLTVKLEYINTASAKQLFLIFRMLEEKSNNCEVKIDWEYPEDDEDIYDSGKYYASLMTNLKFNFIAYADV
jgi:hypothetical protein